MSLPVRTWTTVAGKPWVESTAFLEPVDAPADLVVGEPARRPFEGFGGCFNELGWRALSHLSEADRARVLDDLFLPDRLGLVRCRVPIGASDYARDWYSCDEVAGDLVLDRFSLDRDREMLIPYIREAMARQPELKLFASPWSPPTWMKVPAVCNYGSLSADPAVRDAYARYLLRFVEEYQAEGIPVDQLHVQNEPVSSQKFPSCVMTGVELRDFIRDHLGPVFEAAGMPAQIWLGTLNGPETDNRSSWTTYGHYAGLVLHDAEARRHIAGVSYQWAGRYALQRTRAAWPDLPLMQSENECGDGNNTWENAWHCCDLVLHYLMNDVTSYVWWNLVLEPGGVSSWGWRQNSPVVVDPATRTATWTPDSFILRHFAIGLRPGCRRLATAGEWTPHAVVAEMDGRRSVVVRNPYPDDAVVHLGLPEGTFALPVAAGSLTTVRCSEQEKP